MPRARGAADRGVSRSPGDVHPPGSSRSLRRHRRLPPRSHDRRHLRRGRARSRRLRCRARGEQHRGRGQRHPRPPHRLRGDPLRRDLSGDRAAAPLARRRPRRGQAGALAPSRPGAMPRLAGRQPAGGADGGDDVHRGRRRGGRGRSDGRRHRRRARGQPLWRAHLEGAHRGQPAQRHALPCDRRAGDRGRRRPAGDGTERARQDVER